MPVISRGIAPQRDSDRPASGVLLAALTSMPRTTKDPNEREIEDEERDGAGRAPREAEDEPEDRATSRNIQDKDDEEEDDALDVDEDDIASEDDMDALGDGPDA